MTRDEAINTLANFKVYISGGGVVDKKANEALDLAIATLINLPSAQPERDIPLDYIIDKDGNAICPKCGANVEWHKYCGECGQALKWEESNE